MFELVVYIISVSIIYAYASNRFVAFPADAERANFIAILTLPRRSWYFDLENRELVYLVENTDQVYQVANGAPVPASQLRFKLEMAYKNEDPQTGLPADITGSDSQSSGRRAVAGALINPVAPYEWGETGMVQIEVASNL